jgi:alkylation response protein AidB-like acyl-CoA dehydrogenase
LEVKVHYTELDLNLSEFHSHLKQETRKFAAEVLHPAAMALDQMPVEDVIKKGSIYWQTMKKMYENHYHLALISKEHGGMELDGLSLHIFSEELCYGSQGLAASIFTSAYVALMAQMSGNTRLIDHFVVPFVHCKDASIMSCAAQTEPDHGSDLNMPGTEYFHDKNIVHNVKAVKKGADWILNGQKSPWVGNAPVATNAAVFVNLEPSMGVAGGGICLIDLNLPGISRGKPWDKMPHRELPQGELFFDNVVCPGDQMIIDQQSYEILSEFNLLLCNMATAVNYTAAAQAAYDLALQYSTQRIQGGKRICFHTGIQAKLFDMFAKVQACRTMSRSVMIYNSTSMQKSLQHSSASKVFCTNTACDVVSSAIQIFGAAGLTKSMPIEKLYRDVAAGHFEDGSNDTLAIVAGNKIVREYLNRIE